MLEKIKQENKYIRPHGTHNGSSPFEVLFVKMKQQNESECKQKSGQFHLDQATSYS